MRLLIVGMTIGVLMLSGLVPDRVLAGQSIEGQMVRGVQTGWGAEGIYVYTENHNISLDGCGPVFVIDPRHSMLNIMVASLLSAFHTGAKVNLYVDGCLSDDVMYLKAVGVSK